MVADRGRLIGVWRGAARMAAPDPADRGLAYGDGLFETMRAHAGRLPWWPRHRARLALGAARLGIAWPDEGLLEVALAEALAEAPDGVVKLVLSRGVSARGYAPEPGQPVSLLLSVAPAPAPTVAALKVDRLELRLGVQPALAGIKHLNRLEQVLGAIEVGQRGLDEGLMADSEGRLTCGVRSNLLVRLDGRWLTPPLEHAGVAGTVRALLLASWSPPGGVQVAELPLAVLARADALLLSNALRGILPATRLGERLLDPCPPGLDTARAVLAASHPAFSEP